MDARELAAHFQKRIAAAVAEKNRQLALAEEHSEARADDIANCKRQLETQVLPFFAELKDHMGEQFSFSHQIDIHDHKPVGVSFRVGDGSL